MNKQSLSLDEKALIKVMKALADPIRFRIVQEVSAAKELSCGDLVRKFYVSQPAISHHLKVLGEAEVLLGRNEGKFHYITVNQELLSRLGTLIPMRIKEPISGR